MNPIYYINNTKRKARIVKYLFLLSGVFLLLLILMKSMNQHEETYNKDLNTYKKSITSVKLAKEFNLKIDNPTLEGVSKDNLPYTIMAGNITKQHDNIYNLSSITAKHNLADGSLLKAEAQKGSLDENKKLFILYNDVKITMEDFTLNCEQLHLNLDTNTASSTVPIKVKFRNSTVEAESFCTEDSNNVITFKKGVVTTFNLNDF